MICSKAAFAERSDARNAKRVVRQTYRLPSNVVFCERCDQYHVVVESNRCWNRTRWHEILQYVAQGYRDPEIAPLVELSVRGGENAVLEMTKRLNAMSRPNLVAIAICLGILNPNDFVPTVSERNHP